MPVKVRELMRVIEQDGWFLVRTTGRHKHYNHPSKPGTVTIPGNLGKDVPEGTNQAFAAGRVEMIEPLRYAVVFERSEVGYGAFVADLPGCITVGDTLAETEQNIREAISGHIGAMEAHGEIVPSPTTLTEYIEVPLAKA